jgi:diadenosine tetraphosphate (Ap4A) HIT family hydrolase
MRRTRLGDEGEGIAEREAPHRLSAKGHVMIEFEYHKMRSAELIREAEQARLAREAARAHRAARRAGSAGPDGAAAESHTGRPRRHRLPRTA